VPPKVQLYPATKQPADRRISAGAAENGPMHQGVSASNGILYIATLSAGWAHRGARMRRHPPHTCTYELKPTSTVASERPTVALPPRRTPPAPPGCPPLRARSRFPPPPASPPTLPPPPRPSRPPPPRSLVVSPSAGGAARPAAGRQAASRLRRRRAPPAAAAAAAAATRPPLVSPAAPAPAAPAPAPPDPTRDRDEAGGLAQGQGERGALAVCCERVRETACAGAS
jgi:hypothetical protein